MNRLAHERSPYLLQHARNPVNWYPWGEAAFTRARVEHKPIFLSIGYSTCHWCHVMEHESFESDDIAAVLNAHFIAIKVDREERPDVDRVYMTFVQATTGSGGWPMSVWLTPELKPFYGGTYFPPQAKWGRPGFIEVLNEIARVWQAEQPKLLASADEVTAQLAAHVGAAAASAVPPVSVLTQIADEFVQLFDRQHGGFGHAPKFPRPSELFFLLREHVRSGRAELRDVALQTLRAIAIGGMRDHVGGGFHRYSVDRAWRVPHFEKMLYDQAQLVLAYVDAAQTSGDAFFIEVAEDTLQYVMREMTDAGGGFYSAEDADSVPPEAAKDPGAGKTEGAFYLWRDDEILRLFGVDADVVRGYFGILPDGNAPADPHGEFAGRNVLYVAKGLTALAEETGRTPAAVEAILQQARARMFEARCQRPRPHLDDKILTAWNGLMIAAFARLARLMRGLGERGSVAAAPYLDAARAAAGFVRDRLWNPDTRTLLRRYRDGDAEIGGYAEDYAYLIFGLLELFAADANAMWLQWAVDLQERQDELFWDEVGGGWFSTVADSPDILLRLKESHDGAEPTATSIGAANLSILTQWVDRPGWRDRLEAALRGFGATLDATGRAVPMMASVLSMYYARPAQVVVLDDGSDGSRDLIRALAVRFLPHVVVLTPTAEQRAALAALLPHLAAMAPVSGTATAYVCRGFACLPPLTAADALLRELDPGSVE